MKLSTRSRGDMVQVTIEGTRAQLTALSAAIARAASAEEPGRGYRIAGFIEVKIQPDPDHVPQARGRLIPTNARRPSAVRLIAAASHTKSRN